MYRELKWEVEFEEYLKYLNGALIELFLKFCLGTYGLFQESLGWHAGGDESKQCCNCEACKESVEHVLFMCIVQFLKKKVLDYLKQVLLPDTFEALMHCSIFKKTVLYLEEKQGMVVSNDCSLRHNRVGNVLILIWEGRKEFCIARDQLIRFLGVISFLSARPMIIMAMVIEHSDLFLKNKYSCYL